MKKKFTVAIVDEVDLNEEDISRLETVAIVKVFTGTPNRDELVSRTQGADIVVTGWSHFDANVLEELSGLKLISIWATGTDYVDLPSAANAGVAVSNVPGYAANSVAEFAIGGMIAVARQFRSADTESRKGKSDWRPFQGTQLFGKSLGVVGAGAIGAQVIALGRALGMQVVAHTSHPSIERSEELGVPLVGFQELLKSSDFISINCALTPTSRGMFNAEAFSIMKKGAILSNTARAEIVDTNALADAIIEDQLYGAFLDCVDLDIAQERGLFDYDNILFTPHCAFNTPAAVRNKSKICVNNIIAFIEGTPENIVN